MKIALFKFLWLRTTPVWLALTVATLCAFSHAAPTVAEEAATSGGVETKLLRSLKNDFVVTELAWHPDGRNFAVAQVLSKRVAIWDVAEGKVVRTVETEPGGVHALAYSPDGKYLAVGRELTRHTQDHAHVHLYDAKTGALLYGFVPPSSPPKGDSNDVQALAFSPDSRYLAAVGYGSEGTGVVYELATRKVMATIPNSRVGWAPINTLAYSSDGNLIAAGRVGGGIDILSTRTWKLHKRLEGQTGGVHALAFSPDGRQLAAGTNVGERWERQGDKSRQVLGQFDDDVVLWSVPTFEKATQFPSRHFKRRPNSSIIHDLQYSPDGKLLLVIARSKSLEIIDLARGQTALYSDNFGTIVTPRFSPDGKYLAIVLDRKIEIHQLIRR